MPRSTFPTGIPCHRRRLAVTAAMAVAEIQMINAPSVSDPDT
jgi:hypothetical protein